MTPDPITDKLARFTPDASRIDPAEILFRAGRASARAPHVWRLAVAGLLLTNLVTVGFLSIRPEQPQPAPDVLLVPVVVPVLMPSPEPPPSPEAPLSPWSLGVLKRLAEPRDLPRSPVVADLVPADPPLTPHSLGELN